MKPPFDYATFTARGIGFVTADEQARHCQSCVFACGVGGMGGAAFVDFLRLRRAAGPAAGKPERSDIAQTRARRGAQRECVMTHSSSRRWVDLQIAIGMLMVCQMISNLLDKTTRMSCRGWFFNLYRRLFGASSPWATAPLAPRIGWGRFNHRMPA